MTHPRRRPTLRAALGVGLLPGFLLAACASEPEGNDTTTAEPSATATTVAETASTAQAADGRYISWREHRIDDQELAGGLELRGADGLKLADLDRDGHLDIVSVHEDSDHVRLAFGSNDPDQWQLVTLAEGDEAGGAEDAAVGDVDGDGWLDVLVACERSHLIFLRNPGADTVRSGTWPRLVLASTQGRGSWIRAFLADLDGDGDLEATAPNKGPEQYAGQMAESDADDRNAISWFEIEGDPLSDASWTEHVLTEVPVPITARPVDLDQDGDLDILGGSRMEARIFWFENEPANGAPHFRERSIEIDNRTVPLEPGPKRLTGMNVDFADIDGDGRLDIVLQETPLLNVWLEQPDDLDAPWTVHPIGDLGPDSPTGVTLADIDDDGDLDLITGGYSQDPRDHDGEDITLASRVGRLAWFANPTAQGGDPRQRWTRHDIVRRVRDMNDQFVAHDMDGDGDLDFVTTRGNSGEYDGVFWLEQVRTDEPAAAFTPARPVESRHLALP